MKYLLDTNICIHFFREKFNMLEKLKAAKLENCAISEITLAELAFGAENSSNPKKNRKLIDEFISYIKVLPVFNAINIYATEKVKLKRSGNMISDFDHLIAATAMANGLIMVTENLKEFNRIEKLKIENWVDRNND